MKGALNLILALPAEASPIIGYFNLQLIISEPYKIYTNHDNSIRLVLSGIGKLHANKAVSNIEKESGSKKSQAWLNIGVAGHLKRPIGSMVAAHKITDKVSNRSWYPPMIIDFPCDTGSILTVDEETQNYPDEELVEMEDWIGIYNNNKCVGSIPWLGELTSVPAMGFDGTDLTLGYLESGELPSFKIYDSSEDSFYPADVSNNFEWQNNGNFVIDDLNGNFFSTYSIRVFITNHKTFF